MKSEHPLDCFYKHSNFDVRFYAVRGHINSAIGGYLVGYGVNSMSCNFPSIGYSNDPLY